MLKSTQEPPADRDADPSGLGKSASSRDEDVDGRTARSHSLLWWAAIIVALIL